MSIQTGKGSYLSVYLCGTSSYNEFNKFLDSSCSMWIYRYIDNIWFNCLEENEKLL